MSRNGETGVGCGVRVGTDNRVAVGIELIVKGLVVSVFTGISEVVLFYAVDLVLFEFAGLDIFGFDYLFRDVGSVSFRVNFYIFNNLKDEVGVCFIIYAGGMRKRTVLAFMK